MNNIKKFIDDIKKIKIRSSYTYIIFPLFLVIVLLSLVGSFAWFRNILTIQGTIMNTGQIKYDFEGFYKDASGKFIQDFAYSTEDNKSGYEKISIEEVPAEPVRSSSSFSVTSEQYGEIYYVVSKLDGSVDLNVLLHINVQKGENMSSLNDYIGGFWYQIETKVLDQNASAPTTAGDNDTRVLNVSGMFGEPDPDKNIPMQNIVKNTYSLELAESKYCVVRLTYGLNSDATASTYLMEDGNPVSLRIIPELYVEQKGIPRDENDGEKVTHIVQNLSQLQDAMLTYNSGDTIRIEKSLLYEGDLTFPRPVTVEIVSNSELTVAGKLTFSYHGVDNFHSFKLDTTNGRVKLEQAEINGEYVGGDFYIDTPYSAFYLVGNGKNDITVPREKDFAVNVSFDEGLYLIRFTALDEYSATRAIYLRNEISVNVDKNSTVGEFSVQNGALYRVAISNHGKIETIDLIKMSIDENSYSKYEAPAILIENNNKIENGIRLPSNSQKYADQSGNTQVVWHQGASGTTSIDGQFGSNFGNNDIDKQTKHNIVEKLNESGTEILVHYMRGWNDTEAPTLESIIAQFTTHAAADMRIADVSDIESMTVVCYESIVLTAADYAFIQTMSALKTLDLSSAASQSGTVPNSAFQNLQMLSSVTMSSSDTVWGTYLFSGTNVNEVTIPINTQTFSTTTFAKKVGNVDQYLTYIHVAQSGAAKTALPKDSYIFLPDETTKNNYTSAKYYHAFVEATKYSTLYGDFFLRSANGGYELVTYAGSHVDWYRAFDIAPDVIKIEGKDDYIRLNMDNLNADGRNMKIVSIGPYAFYDSPALRATETNTNKFYLILGDGVNSIGEYAFYNTSAIVAIEGANVTYCANYAIHTCNNLRKVIFPKMNSVGLNKQPFIQSCTELFWLETGIVNTRINGSACTTLVSSCNNLVVYLIHGNSTDNFDDMTAVGNRDGSGRMYRFASSTVIALYTSSGVNQNISVGSLSIADIDFYPIVPSGDIFTVPKFATIIRDSQEEILVCTRAKLEADSVFTDFPAHVTRIGDNAFRYLSIYSNTETASLNFPSQVTYVGICAFYGNDKNYHTLYLNNVVTVNQSAFEKNQMLFAYGPNLLYLGDYAFAGSSIHYVELPEWRYSYGPVKNYGYYFWECKSLKYALLGPMDSVRNWAFYQCTSLTCVFIDAEERSAGAGAIPNLGWYTGNTERFIVIASGGKSVVDTGYEAKSKEVIVDSFEDFIYADFTSDNIAVGNVRGKLTYPKSVCARGDNNTITYVKSMQGSLSDDYTTPENIYKLDNQVQFLGKTVYEYTVDPAKNGIAAGVITKIGVNAYFGVTFSGTASITVAPSVIELGSYAFRECKASYVDLNRVQKIGSYCFLSATNLQRVKADNVQVLGGYAFQNCKNINEITLPSFVESTGTAPFYESGVTSVTLGKNTKNLGTKMFQQCKNLLSITIQSPTIPTATTPFSVGSGANATVLANISLSVQKSADYLAGNAASWNGLPASQINFFGNITLISGVEFYWDFVEQDETVEIIMIRFSDTWTAPESGAFVIPSSVVEEVNTGETLAQHTYYVVGVNEASILSIKTAFSSQSLVSLTLPYGMQTMDFSRDVLPNSLKELVIPETLDGYTGSVMFSTQNGVLYDKDKTILLIYPSAKEATSFEVPSTVRTISPRAFRGAGFTTVTITGPVVIMDAAFEECVSLTTLTFTSSSVSVFAGRDIFDGNIALTSIYVPAGTVTEYAKNVFYDAKIRSLLQESAT